MDGSRARQGDPRSRWLVLAGVWSLYFCFGLGFIDIAPLIGPISDDLGLSATRAGMILGAWQFVFMVAAIPAAMAMLRLGAARALTFAGAAILTSLALRCFASDFWTLAGSVALLGLGGPVVSIGSPTLVQRHFAGRQMGFAIGLVVSAPSLATILCLALNSSVLLPLFGGWRGVLGVWAGVAAALYLFWCLVAPADRGGRQARLADVLPRDGRVLPICLTAILIFVIEHGYRSWITEVAREAGYGLERAGMLSAFSIAMGLIAILSVPAFAVRSAGRFRVTLTLCTLVALALVAISRAEAGPVFVGAVAVAGFSAGPLLTIGLLPIVTDAALRPERRILTIALYFSTAQVGGTLGPVLFGVAHDLTGGFTVALWGMAAVALAIPLMLRLAAPRDEDGSGTGEEYISRGPDPGQARQPG